MVLFARSEKAMKSALTNFTYLTKLSRNAAKPVFLSGAGDRDTLSATWAVRIRSGTFKKAVETKTKLRTSDIVRVLILTNF